MSGFILFFVLIVTMPVWASELDPVEVEAQKDLERFTFSSTSTISERDLNFNTSGLVSSLMMKVPGVISGQNGGPGGRVSFFLRGTEGRHVSFNMDGLKINDTSNVDRQFDAAFMTSAHIREIKVHKGPQAVLYGSDAIGGLIEIETRKGENAPETRLSFNAGSFGTVDSSLSSDWKTGKHQGTLTLFRFHTDGISRLNKKRWNAKEADSSDITQGTSSSSHEWGERISTDFLFSFLRGEAEQDTFGSDNSFDESQNDQYIAQQTTHYDMTSSQSLSLRTGLNRHQRLNKSLDLGAESFNGNLIQHELLHRLEQKNIGFLSGIATENESSGSQKSDKAFDLHSLFVQSSLILNALSLHAGGRIDDHSKYGQFFTGSSGISYVAGSQEIFLQYSKGFKAPSLYQIYDPLFGNPELQPETNHSWELGLRNEAEALKGEIVFFQNRLNNLITYIDQNFVNQGRFIAEGIELSATAKMNQIHIQPSFTHQQFREEESAVLRRPYNSAQLGFSYFPLETLELNLLQRWYSSRKDHSGESLVKLNGYNVTDIGVAKTWQKDEVGIELKNIFDREYEEIYGYSVLPRALFIHYGHIF